MTSDLVELADANVLVALVVAEHPDHHAARRWLATVPRFATTPLTETALVRLLLNPNIVTGSSGSRLTITEALSALNAVKSQPNAVFLADSTSLADARAMTAHIQGHRQVTDAHLLSLAIAQGGVLATFDVKLANSLGARAQKHVRVIADM